MGSTVRSSRSSRRSAKSQLVLSTHDDHAGHALPLSDAAAVETRRASVDDLIIYFLAAAGPKKRGICHKGLGRTARACDQAAPAADRQRLPSD